jgi:hypothetical protein
VFANDHALSLSGCLRGGDFVLPEKDPLYPKCISRDLPAILIQTDDAKAQ